MLVPIYQTVQCDIPKDHYSHTIQALYFPRSLWPILLSPKHFTVLQYKLKTIYFIPQLFEIHSDNYELRYVEAFEIMLQLFNTKYLGTNNSSNATVTFI